ncbi:hypothetical protein EEB14_38725 [Rhodococcus sp. WS4]|nr:hypothetical protein EEB14_38725 [Rhodococcus sp. WS4]
MAQQANQGCNTNLIKLSDRASQLYFEVVPLVSEYGNLVSPLIGEALGMLTADCVRRRDDGTFDIVPRRLLNPAESSLPLLDAWDVLESYSAGGAVAHRDAVAPVRNHLDALVEIYRDAATDGVDRETMRLAPLDSRAALWAIQAAALRDDNRRPWIVDRLLEPDSIARQLSSWLSTWSNMTLREYFVGLEDGQIPDGDRVVAAADSLNGLVELYRGRMRQLCGDEERIRDWRMFN